MKHDEYTVIISPGANERMYEHFEFMSRVSAGAASRLLEELLKDIRSLRSMPTRNPSYDKHFITFGSYRYLLSCKRYRIVYKIDGSSVYVDDIQDCRQSDEQNILT